MFGGFEQVRDERARKRWFASAGTSLIIYVAVGVGLLILARQTVAKAKEEPPIDVTFRAAPEAPEAVKAEVAPPPPPRPTPHGKRPGKVAPVQPRAIPTDRPEEGTPTGEAGGDEIGTEFGDGEGRDPLPPAPPPPPPPAPPQPPALPPPAPVEERDDVVLPVAQAGNAMPTYPEVARKKGLQGEVILEIRISESGAVVDVEVVRGDEPFVAAALAAVRTWRYRPALVDGRPVPFTRRIKIPFRIRS